VLAEALLGHGEQAYEYYRKALPMNPVVHIDRYEMEPYVYSEYVTSPDHPTFGQASHSWLTGSSTWMLRDVTDYILGVRPTYEGLIIDPCVPRKWKEFRIRRRFRGKIFEIHVKNPKGVEKGVASITVDGNGISGNLIPVEPPKSQPRQRAKWPVVQVEVIMG